MKDLLPEAFFLFSFLFQIKKEAKVKSWVSLAKIWVASLAGLGLDWLRSLYLILQSLEESLTWPDLHFRD